MPTLPKDRITPPYQPFQKDRTTLLCQPFQQDQPYHKDPPSPTNLPRKIESHMSFHFSTVGLGRRVSLLIGDMALQVALPHQLSQQDRITHVLPYKLVQSHRNPTYLIGDIVLQVARPPLLGFSGCRVWGVLNPAIPKPYNP